MHSFPYLTPLGNCRIWKTHTSKMPTANGIQVLPPGAGYGIVIGIGGVFALFMLSITWIQNRYTSFSTHQAEEFNTASRSVKPGLIAAGIVSAWSVTIAHIPSCESPVDWPNQDMECYGTLPQRTCLHAVLSVISFSHLQHLRTNMAFAEECGMLRVSPKKLHCILGSANDCYVCFLFTDSPCHRHWHLSLWPCEMGTT